MLVLSRKLNEEIRIGRDVVITVVEIDRGKIRLGITAPPEVKVLRGELLTRPTHAPRPEPEVDPYAQA